MPAIPHILIACAKRLFAFGVFLLAIFSYAPNALAQYQFDTWTTENGLPQNSVNDILQTRDGYLWLATFGGLVRFDGVRFVVFDRSIEGIKSQRIKALYEDKKGTLWAVTEEGMLIRYRDGKFTTFAPDARLPTEEAFRIDEDDEGNLWITGRGMVIKFDGEHFVNYQRGDFAPDVNDYYRRYKIWWKQDSTGLHCFVKGRLQTSSLPDLSNIQIIGVSADIYGNLWIETKGEGVVKLANGQLKRYTVREGLPSNNLSGIFLEDRKGNLWLAVHEGSSLYRIRDGKYELTRTFPPFSLAMFYEDREGAVWIGTSTGLYRIRESAITLYTERQGLSLNWAYSIFQDRAGAIWIGTWGGGLNKYENGRFTRYGKAEGLPSNNITCNYEDKSGRLWVGANGGVSYFENGRFKPYNDERGFLKRDIWAIHEDRASNLWLGTDQGLVKLQDGNFTEYTTKDGLPYNVIRSLFEDRAGTLWIGTDQGLTRLKDGVFTSYTERDGFIGNQVRAIHEDSDGILWIGTYDGGLYRFKDDRLTRYTTKEGLHDNGVFQILEDDTGNLWMGCNRGVYRVSRQELNDFAEGKSRSITSVAYGTKDGLATLECNGGRQPSGLKTKDGKLLFPTMGGVAVIDLKALQIQSQPPPVIIEEFRLNNEAVDFSGSVEIPPDKDNFEIRYTAPSFSKPEQVRFKYRLVGLDKDWIDAGDRRIANYNQIPSGRYQFVVIAANSDGVWNTEGKTIEIVIIPPFYWRWWFVALAAIFLLATPLLLYRSYSKRRLQRVENEKSAQEAFSRKLIESQESERKRIASELHDDLGQKLLMIRNWAQVMLSKKLADEGMRKRLTEISDTSLQSLDEVRRIAHHLRPHLIDSLGLTQAINVMLNQVADSSGIRFDCEVKPIDNLFSEEGEINVYRIVQECLNNIVKHSSATTVRVTIKKSLHAVVIEIEDNGRGFDVQASSLKGLGLNDITERVRILKGRQRIDSVPGRGTKITAKLNLQGGRDEQ